MTPTPIHSWKLPGVPDRFDVSIKREDMIGSTLSGNKVKCVCIEGMSHLTIFFLLDTTILKKIIGDPLLIGYSNKIIFCEHIMWFVSGP